MPRGKPCESPGAVLGALVGMYDHARGEAPFMQCILKGPAAKHGRHGVGHPHGNDLSWQRSIMVDR